MSSMGDGGSSSMMWARKAEFMAKTNGYDVIADQRGEIEQLQRRCQDLILELVLHRRAMCQSFRDFCIASAVGGSVPLRVLLDALARISDGLVPADDPNRRKRDREFERQNRNPPPQQPPLVAQRGENAVAIACGGEPIGKILNRKRSRDENDDTMERQPMRHRPV